VTAVLLR